LLYVVAAFTIGFFTAKLTTTAKTTTLHTASAAELASARQDIVQKYKEENSTKCSDLSDPISPVDRGAVFEKYLKVNKYANRAVARGCNDIDFMLYKDSSGLWQRSNVNISLDTRANPKWQEECYLQDITTADDVVRPENSSIDENNYNECHKIK
jgi:hypothetical protein